jgi:uncharacterized protein (TIGR02452 family)
MNREQRARIAQETANILQHGTYPSPHGQTRSIRESLAAACTATQLYLPSDYDDLVARMAQLPTFPVTRIAISNQTTLAAAHTLASTSPTLACLNFASAKNPGGGFLSGSHAQEESLARASGLVATLQTQPAFYAVHRHLPTALYSDHVIFSPDVPIFRDDTGQLLDQPWHASFLTAAAVNAGAVRTNEPHNRARIRPTLEHRARMVLAIAANHGCATLVLGAWGCGVFQNDPIEVASIFATVLADPRFQQRFQHIEFAVFDTSASQPVLRAFQNVFAEW